jgi:predicted nucleotidyltransferase
MVALTDKRKAYVEELQVSLDRITHQLSKMDEVSLVVLFGSYARGRRDLFTDLDLLVVVEDSDLDFITRTADLYQRLQPGVDMDLVVYTRQEFEQMRGGGFVRQALITGKVLYEKIAA